MPDFIVGIDEVRWTLNRVHWWQTGFMLFIAGLVAAAPRSRFGPSYKFIIEAPGGQYNVAAVFAAIGLFLWWALRSGRRKWMSRALFLGGIANGVFAVSLLFGAIFGPTGVVGAPYTFYVAGHMLIQSELLGTRRTGGAWQRISTRIARWRRS